MYKPVVAAFVIAVGLAAAAISAPLASDAPRSAEQAPRDGIEAFFVGGPGRQATGAWTEADERFTELAAEAASSIDLAAYSLDRDSVLDALLGAWDEDVDVRVVVDTLPGAGGAVPWRPLEDARIPIVRDDRSSAHHNKFAVVDGAVVWTGSANFTDGGFASQSNNVLVITSTTVADIYTCQFTEMHEHKKFGCGDAECDCADATVGGALVRIAFGPCDCVRERIEDAIASADASLYVAMYRFTDLRLARALVERHSSGVHVVVLMSDAGFDLDDSVVRMLQSYGISVLEESLPGEPYLHDKFAVVDAGTKSDPLVITGSPNWSGNGMDRNDENSLVIHSGALAQQFCQRFSDLASTVHPDIGVRCESSSWLPLALRRTSLAVR